MLLFTTILLFGKISVLNKVFFFSSNFWFMFEQKSLYLLNLLKSLSISVVALIPGFASAQKVIQLSYCSVGENHLRMDCKYALPQESPEPFCKYTQGERLLDTTNPDEEQHAPFKNRAKARLFPGNICRLLFKNLPNGKSNFTCNIKQAESATATKTSVVEKSKLPLMAIVPRSSHLPVILCAKIQHPPPLLIAVLLLPCSAWSVLLQSCSGLMLTFMTLPVLLETHWQ